MIIEFIYNMSLVILFIMLSLRLKEHLLKSNISDPYYYKISISFLAAFITVVLMKRPFVYYGVAFDLKSIPLLLVSYIYGWQYGLVVAIFPIFYRGMLGGEIVYGVVFFEILLSVIIGGLFHKAKDSIIISVDRKRVFKSYILFLIVGFTMFFIFFDYSLYFWIKIIAVYSFFSLVTLLNSVMLINDTNQSIYHNIIEYNNLKEDLTENKNKLKKTKNKMDLIGKLSHEFKTPLNLIFSAVQMLKIKHKENKKNNCKINKYLNIISQNGYRMLRLVNNLIDLVKMDVESFTLNFKNVDIVKLLEKLTNSVKDYVDSKKRRIEFISELDKKIIKCDPVNIERIILNLLSNAVKFTEKGDKITVKLYKENNEIKISVQDEGIGMKKEKLKDIFDEFSQIDDSMTRNSEGSGLGLSIVKSLVKMHNGKITVDSEYGHGSEFVISLPDKRIEGEDVKEVNLIDNLDRTAVELSDVNL